MHTRINPQTASDADFQKYEGLDYAPEKMTKKALAFIDQHQDKPFFLYLPYTIPHVGLQAPQEWVEKYIGKFKEEKPYYGEQGYNPSRYPLSTYAAMISYLDAQVGLLLDKIKDLGLDEHTIIMFSSDNGATFNGGVQTKYFNSLSNLRGYKMDLFEGGIREPFIVRWPGSIKAGTQSDLISVQYDMMATFAELANTKTNNTDGISLLPTLTGQTEKQQQREYIYFEYPEKGGQVAVRMGQWKAVRIDVRKDKDSPWMLFNLNEDPSEQLDVAKEHPDIIKRMDEIQLREHQNSHLLEWEFLNNKMKK